MDGGADVNNELVGDVVDVVDQELNFYWNAPKLQRVTPNAGGGVTISNPLAWWAQNCERFPLVGKLARRTSHQA